MIRHLLSLLAVAALAVPAWSQHVYNIQANVGTPFTDISATGTNQLSLVDDAVTASIALPFTFNLYGADYTSLFASSNGNLQLGGAPLSNFTNSNLLTTNSLNTSGFIAPFWDDLDSTGTGFAPPTGSIFTQSFGAPGSQVFVVQWNQWGHNDDSNGDVNRAVTFQVKLFEGSNDVAFIYADKVFPFTGADDGASATIGISSGPFDDPNNPVAQFLFNSASLGSINDLLFTTTAVPEPATLMMGGTSLAIGLATAYRLYQRKRRIKKKTRKCPA